MRGVTSLTWRSSHIGRGKRRDLVVLLHGTDGTGESLVQGGGCRMTTAAIPEVIDGCDDVEGAV